MWTVGGVRNGRRVNDVCVFDTIKMEWASGDELRCGMKPREVDGRRTGGRRSRRHAAVAFGPRFVIGGHTREDDPVDAQCEVWVLETTAREEPAQGRGRRAVRQGRAHRHDGGG